MDFLSRDRQRQAVEELSEPSGEAQVRVALRAVESARQVSASGMTADRAAHVGYHLIDRGRRDLESDVAYVPNARNRALRFLSNHASGVYLGTIAILTAALLYLGLAYGRQSGASSMVQVGIALLLLLPASDVAIACIQRLTARLIPPKRLPRLDFSTGVPENARTMVIVPTMLTSEAGVDALLSHVEVLALGNLDPCVHFAILTDFADAGTRATPEDEAILERASTGVEALNLKLGAAHTDRFFLFHRARQWNAKERVWMGWERKRGKIEEFNRLLRGATDTSFSTHVGNLDVLPSVRYCITLDSDTLLPRDAARQLIGIIEHPLNRPRFERSGRARDAGVRHPATSRQRHDVERGGVALRADLRRSYRRGSVYDRGLGCLSGSVRRRHLHWERLVRRRCVHRVARAPGAGQCVAFARPVRGTLRSNGARQRHRVDR